MKLDADSVNRYGTIQCDNEEGCHSWPHWECEGLTEAQTDDIDEYACKGCLEKGAGETTLYPGTAMAQYAIENAVQSDDEDDLGRYTDDGEDLSDSDDSGSESDDAEKDTEKEYDGLETDSESETDGSDYQTPVTAGGKRKAAAQPGPKLRAQKKSKQAASGSRKPLVSRRVAPVRSVRIRRFQLTD